MKSKIFNKKLPLLIILLLAVQGALKSQCSVGASSDTTICTFGTSVQLNATPGGTPLGYSWSPTTGLSSSTIANPQATITSTTKYFVTASFLTSTELVTNGNFESGNTGFSSAYTYNSAPVPYTNNLAEEEYYVGTDPSAIHQCFAACTDHTSGSGKMMIINGSSTANVKVWKQTVTVQQNTDYLFSAWLNNVTCGVGYNAQLQFSIDSTLLGSTFESDSALCSWKKFSQVWNSGSHTSIEISIVNQNTDANGNDFALDDISFRAICYATDSVTITFAPKYYTQNLILCAGDSVLLPSEIWVDTAGTFYDTLQTGGGCDSIVTTNISMFTATELVSNGDFESGNTGFSSDYTYNSAPVPYTNNLDEEEYYVGTDPSATHQCFAACTDHTSGSGKMMIINGAPTANVKVWKQTVSVQTNTYYRFSAWISNVTCGVGYNALLQFSIGGSLVGDTVSSDSSLCSWKNFTAVWNSGSNTSVEISVVNQNTDANGNDFALDDISFKEICPNDTSGLTFSKNGTSLGVKRIEEVKFSDVYPNPTSDKLFINVKNTGNDKYYVKLVDLTGKVVLSKVFESNGVSQIELDVNDIPSGYYVATIGSSNQVFNENHKVVIIK